MSSSSFPILSTDVRIRNGVVLGRGRNPQTNEDVFVKLAERGVQSDHERKDREAEILVNQRVAHMIRMEDRSPTSKCFLAAECHPFDLEAYVFEENNQRNEPWLFWLRELADWNAKKYGYGRRNWPWRVVFFVMRPLPKKTLHDWWIEENRTDDERKKMFAQLVLVLETMARYGITHNDMHWGNVKVEENISTAFRVPTPTEDDGEDWRVTKYRPVVYDWDRSVLDADRLFGVREKLAEYAIRYMNNRYSDTGSAPHVAVHHPYVDLLALYKSAVMSSKNLDPIPSWLIDVCKIVEEKVVAGHPSLRHFKTQINEGSKKNINISQISCLEEKSTATPERISCDTFVKNPTTTVINVGSCARNWTISIPVPSEEDLSELYARIVDAALGKKSPILDIARMFASFYVRVKH